MTELKLKLIEFGFSDKEANVYLAMMELGPASVQEIAKKAGVNRATTYVMIEALKRRGLMSCVEKGKKTVFAAESPEHLLGIVRNELRLIEDKKSRLEDLMPQFLGLFNSMEDKPKVRYFEGEEGANACREVILNLGKGTGVARVFINYDKEMLAAAKFNEHQRFQLMSGANTFRFLYSLADGESLPIFKSNVIARPLPLSAPKFSGECNIYEKFILVSSATNSHWISVVIESEEVARLFQCMFDIAWSATDKGNREIDTH